jgi:hypothetical protein
MTANLDIANIDFEDFVDEAGEQDDGARKWQSFDPGTDDKEDVAEGDIKKETALRELRDGGYAD